MSIYYIGTVGGDFVKIGHSADPTARLRSLQCGSPDRLVLLATEPGGRDVEQQIHEECRAQWVRGEWFRSSPVLRRRIELAAISSPVDPDPTPVPRTCARRDRRPLIMCIQEEPIPGRPFGAVEVAARLGVKRGTVDMWRQRAVGFPQPRWTVGGRPAWNWDDIEAWAKERDS